MSRIHLILSGHSPPTIDDILMVIVMPVNPFQFEIRESTFHVCLQGLLSVWLRVLSCQGRRSPLASLIGKVSER
jgi:hypothetical protein